MKITKHLVAIVLLASLFSACKQTDFKKTKEGYPYKIFSDGKGEKIMPGYFVSLHQTIKLGDSILQTTYGGQPQFLPLPKDTAGGKGNDLTAMLLQAHKGDSILIKRPVDSIIRQNPQAADPFLLSKKGQFISYVFKVVDVFKTQDEAMAVMEKQSMDAFNNDPQIKAQRTKDEAAIEAYLKANNIQTQRTPWGDYIQIITPGTGPKPKNGQFAMLRYTGKDMSGKVFDTNNKPGAQLLPVQVGAGGTIPGFDDAVKTLSKGTKANVYIPSVLAYGAQGRPPVIQPNQNLVFELEVVDVTDQRPAPQMPPMQQMPDSTGK
jgi:FKBP-type peptidyl-prolyl cis-trans isomerase